MCNDFIHFLGFHVDLFAMLMVFASCGFLSVVIMCSLVYKTPLTLNLKASGLNCLLLPLPEWSPALPGFLLTSCRHSPTSPSLLLTPLASYSEFPFWFQGLEPQRPGSVNSRTLGTWMPHGENIWQVKYWSQEIEFVPRFIWKDRWDVVSV